MWGQYLLLLVLVSTAFPIIPLEILVTNHTSIENGTFVFKYQVGQDAVIPLSFTSKILNVNEVEVIWYFKNTSDGEMEEIFLFEEKPRSFKERVEFSGNISREDFSITIHNTSLSDSGYYTCHVSNHNNMKANTTTVLLEIFPRETYEQIKTDKGDTVSKLVFILIVLFMAILTCTVVFLVNRRQKNIKEETDSGSSLIDNEDDSNVEKV